MEAAQDISTQSLIIASLLVVIALVFSYWQKLKLEKEIVISMARAVIQLVAVGFVLEWVFGMDSPWFTTLLLLFMTVNAAYNAAKRGKGIEHGFRISFIAITAGSSITLTVLILTDIVQFIPQHMIPIGGMIISNAMIALGLCYKNLNTNFNEKRPEIEAKLALGADTYQASAEIVRDSIRTGMIPTIDSAKTLGIVSLPGMMTGLILAGASPLMAIKYQIMVTFMLLSTTAIASFIACYRAYHGFYNDRKQLK